MVARNKTIDTRGKPRIWNLLGERTRRDFLLQAAAGQIPGVSAFHVFGYDTDLTNNIKLIYPNSNSYIYPQTEQAVSIVSSNINDSIRGSGARILRLVGLNREGIIQTEDMWLKGTTPIYSLGLYKRILTAFILSSGSLNGLLGTLTLAYRDGTHAGIVSSPFNVLTNANFTVPANTNAYLYNYGFCIGAPKEIFTGIRTTSPDSENSNWIVLDFRYTYGGSVNESLKVPYMIGENTDIELIGYTRADSTTYISACMDLLLIDKEYDWENLIQSEERHNVQKVE